MLLINSYSIDSIDYSRGTLKWWQAGMKLEAYFRLPDGKQSFSPFDGSCKERFASGVDVLFEFGLVQHVPWTWVTQVNGVAAMELESPAREAATTASSGEEQNESPRVREQQRLQKEEEAKRHKLLRPREVRV